jgi:hypothetical protein
MENFWKYEFLSSVLYCPDLVRIVDNGVSVLVAVGEESGDAFDKRAGGRWRRVWGVSAWSCRGVTMGLRIMQRRLRGC